MSKQPNAITDFSTLNVGDKLCCVAVGLSGRGYRVILEEVEKVHLRNGQFIGFTLKSLGRRNRFGSPTDGYDGLKFYEAKHFEAFVAEDRRVRQIFSSACAIHSIATDICSSREVTPEQINGLRELIDSMKPKESQ